MYSWKYIYFTLHKKNPKQDNDKKTKKQNQKHPKTPTDCKLCMLTIPFPLGKPVRGFLANTHCHDKNTYVQTARSLIAVKRLYTQRCHYLTNMQEMEFPEFIAQNSNRHRLRLHGSLPCATAWLLCSGSHFPTVQESEWSFPQAPRRHTEPHHRSSHLPLWTT